MTTSGATAPEIQTDGSNADERDWLLTAGAATLALLALSKRSTIGLAAVLGGGYLLYRSLPGGTLSGLLPESFAAIPGRLSANGSRRGTRDWYPPEDADSVDEASMDSFPASDPAAKY